MGKNFCMYVWLGVGWLHICKATLTLCFYLLIPVAPMVSFFFCFLLVLSSELWNVLYPSTLLGWLSSSFMTDIEFSFFLVEEAGYCCEVGFILKELSDFLIYVI